MRGDLTTQPDPRLADAADALPPAGVARDVALALQLRLDPVQRQLAAAADAPNGIDAAVLRQWHADVAHVVDALARAASADDPGTPPGWRDAPLRDDLAAVRAALADAPDFASVSLWWECDDSIGDCPAGPIGTLLLLGVHDALRACNHPGCSDRRVDVAIGATPQRTHVRLLITDTGRRDDAWTLVDAPGLALAAHVIDLLHGTMTWSGVPFGDGAVLQFDVPIAALSARARAA